ncbi:heavy metal response regulator transcription factor [Acidithiobacillus montserratensis]|uniref:Heavy metal response regulator transcription factor n=1 Tax=Acidithiobacillus montserratensis TaxID=2729135 RepID=A0ACD5HHX5_9PROT|nr:heavy metal response regulator transcription factor [Acidithiobacillus montserratensis]MBN2679900.1 heavy metal response regulator transcription factor [Acidithiobacillaceae bacterium]MBU2746726.1 heavy metal response regulator transcription factor [Acidithiobacillus montserratensis]
MKILVIEDEVKTSAFLKKGFSEEGHVVDLANNGVDGQHLAETGEYEVIILDLMLPQRDGWWVLQEIRKRRSDQAVILLTALDAVDQRVQGLRQGADDYLVKPFAFSELLARVQNILRRSNIRTDEVLHYADLGMDLLRHKIWRAATPIPLAPQEFRLLAYLMRFPGEVLTRTRIAEQVWDMHFESDSNVVDVAIRRLRRKVDDPFPDKLIHTLRGVGYVLELRH